MSEVATKIEAYEIDGTHIDDLAISIEVSTFLNQVKIFEHNPNDQLILSIEIICNQIWKEFGLKRNDYLCFMESKNETGIIEMHQIRFENIEHNGETIFKADSAKFSPVGEAGLKFLMNLQEDAATLRPTK